MDLGLSALAGCSAATCTKRRIAVVGAGVAGLITLKEFANDNNSEVIAYEQQDRIGGVWNYPIGCEEHPDAPDTSPFYCRMYRDMRANGPRDLTRFRDLPWPDKVTDTFPRLSDVTELIHEFAKTYCLLPHILFRRRVRSIEPKDTTLKLDTAHVDSRLQQQWTVTVENLDNQDVLQETFDVVIICNGHYNKPYLPDIPGLSDYGGPVIHSSNYRFREAYTDKMVLVIGAATSGNEIICELLTVCKKVIVCRRQQATVYPEKFKNIVETSNISYTINGIILPDGTAVTIDGIILCTGYQFDFPFLSDNCGVETTRGRVWPLYRHLINCKFPTMAFIGLFPIVPFLIVGPFDQVRYYKAVLDGKVTLPTREEMVEEAEFEYQSRLADGLPPYRAHWMSTRLWPYVRKLAKEAGFEPPEPVLEDMFTQNIESIARIPYDFRNYLHERINANTALYERISVPEDLSHTTYSSNS